MMNMEGGDADGSVEQKADTTDRPEIPAEGKGKEAQKDRHRSDSPAGLGESDIEQIDEEFWLARNLKKPKKSTRWTKMNKFDQLLDQEKANEAQYHARKRASEHAKTSWHFCYDDSCQIHLASKTEKAWFPHAEGGSMNPRREKGQETLARDVVRLNDAELWDEGQNWKQLQTHYWTYDGEDFRLDPKERKDSKVIVTVRKCTDNQCTQRGCEHTHDVVGRPYVELTFKGKPNPHTAYNLSILQKEDEVLLNEPGQAVLRTYRWKRGFAGVNYYDPESEPRKESAMLVLEECVNQGCRDHPGAPHTHSTASGRAYRFPFREHARSPDWSDEEETESQEQEEADYEVVVSKAHLMIFKTRHYQVSKEQGREVLTFDPVGPKQEQSRPVSIRGCHDLGCKAVEHYHSHDTVGGVVVKYDPLMQTIGGLQAKLVSLDENEEEWEEVEPSEDESDDDSVITNGESKLYVVQTTRNWVKIITNYWEEKECTGCSRETGGHTHVRYNPDIEPRTMVNTVLTSFCLNFDCPQGRALHAHHGEGSNEHLMLRFDEEEARQLWGTINPTMTDLLPAAVKPADVPHIDGRAEKGHMYKHFTCAYESCPAHFRAHQHVWNVSPDEPGRPIAKGRYWAMRPCEAKGCPYYGKGHVHSKNDSRMEN